MERLPTILDYDLELFFVVRILGLRSLHYGFWDVAPAHITLASIREAQARFTQRLLELVPSTARTVLDVGAGVGDNARALADRGLSVVAISPDRAHARYFRSRPDDRIRYLRTSFERLDIDQRVDLVFISEALNYFDERTGLEQIRRYLRPRGHLLVAAIFTRSPPAHYERDFDIASEEYVGLARQYDLELLQSRDVTENVIPTISYAGRMLRRYVFPAFRWAPAVKRVRNVVTFYERRTDVDYFRRHFRYGFLLFRASA